VILGFFVVSRGLDGWGFGVVLGLHRFVCSAGRKYVGFWRVDFDGSFFPVD